MIITTMVYIHFSKPTLANHQYTVSGKTGTTLFVPLTLLNYGQFSKFFHRQT